ncbi:hypothetical protein CBS101457_006339 [Exobasidium rhododendri]|nr:hypothetical protein CBS101457_006339 [Exobasidium rhododendri]
MYATPQSRVRRPFQAPGFVKAAKRGSSGASIEGGNSSMDDVFAQRKRPKISPDSRNFDMDNDDSEEEECIPMSESQLDKHSRVSAAPASAKKLDAKKILDAKLERIEMKSKTVEYKEMRNATGTFASPGLSYNNQGGKAGNTSCTRHVLCVWRTPQARKHKTWDGDGCLLIRGEVSGNQLRDTSNKSW